MFVVHILRAYSHLDGQPEVGRSSSQLTHSRLGTHREDIGFQKVGFWEITVQICTETILGLI